MRIENKGVSAGYLIIFLSVILGCGGIWLIVHMYISPFLDSNLQKVMADPLMIVSFLIGASLGMMVLAPINVAFRYFFSRELRVKTIFIFMLCVGIFGGGMNLVLYKWIIEPNHMIECPKKNGYKKNLMRDYVTDISLCEKF